MRSQISVKVIQLKKFKTISSATLKLHKIYFFLGLEDNHVITEEEIFHQIFYINVVAIKVAEIC